MPSVQDVFRNTHCRLRTLEYSFKDVLGITVKKYMVLCKMHNIRRELADTIAADIPSLLTKCGVTNASRFVSDYRRLFGEDFFKN
jgi:AraC-like DNA-binding protein